MKQPTFLFLWTRLGSICSKAGDLVAISLATEPHLTPGQRGANITMCAAISENGVSAHIPHIGPYNTQLLLVFLNTLYSDLIPEQERGLVRPHLPNCVVVWDNVSFHWTDIVRDWFAAHERITVVFLPPYSPFLNPVEEFFQHGGGKYMIIDHKIRCLCWMPWMLIIAGDGCGIHGDFPPVHGNWNVDKNLWTDQQERQDVHQESFFSWMLFCRYFIILCICGNIRNMKCTVIGQAIFHFTSNTFIQN